MTKEWIISDTHFGHNNIERYQDRPKNWEDKIIEQWNFYVHSDDIIYHLGDFSLCNKESYKVFMEILPGRKILILGNHDKFSRSYYLNNGWVNVVDNLTLGNLIFTHAPLMKIPEGLYNIHGHLHGGESTMKRLNVTVENTGYSPINLDKIRNQLKNDIEKFSYRRGWGIRPSYGVGNNSISIDSTLVEYALSQDEDEWIIECQTFPGIITIGDNKHEAIDNFKEAIISYLKECR